MKCIQFVRHGLGIAAVCLALMACDPVVQQNQPGSGGNPPADIPPSVTGFWLSAPPVSGVVDQANRTIKLQVPYGTNVSNLTPEFTFTGVKVSVGGQTQVSAISACDFTNPVVYTVFSAQGQTVAYTVTVLVAASGSKTIDSLAISGYPASATIDQASHIITLELPYGTNLSNLIPVFSISGSALLQGGRTLVSGQSACDFSSDLTVTVAAADRTRQDYVIRLSVAAPATSKEISSFSINGLGAASIDQANRVIFLAPLPGSPLQNRVAQFATSGVRVLVGQTLQTSGQSVNDFSQEVSYTVMAEDGSSRVYKVIVLTGSPACSATLKPFREVTLAWTDQTGQESDWVVQRSVDSSAWADYQILPANSTGFTDYPAAGANYGYRVYARNSHGKSQDSASASVQIPLPPNAPSGLKVDSLTFYKLSGATSFAVRFSWFDQNYGQTGFRIFTHTSTSFPGATNAGIDIAKGINTIELYGITTTDNYFEEVTRYYCMVRAENDGGYTNSPTTSFVTGLFPPEHMLCSGCESNGSYYGYPILKWVENSVKASSYTIARSYTSPTTGFTDIASIGPGIKTYTDRSCTAPRNSTVYYRVYATEPGGASSQPADCAAIVY